MSPIGSPAGTIRQRRSTDELVMPWATFQAADFGQVCAQLGLRPSQPNRSADGKDKRPRRRPRASKPSG